MPDDPIPAPTDAEGFLDKNAPPPWGTESRELRLARLLGKSRQLARVPGVYLMKDSTGVVLYVGKAAALPERVSSYFVPSADLGGKKQELLDHVHDFEFLLCESEWEALLTENRLIKDIRPRFNVRLTDDKTFPYLVVTTREDFPRIFVTRNPAGVRDDGTIAPEMKSAKIYGPFASASALREAVAMLQRVFKFRTCKLDIIANAPGNARFRPCLLYSINQCTAPCADKIGKEPYREDVERFTRFLTSKRSQMLRELSEEMNAAAGQRKYEKAAALRDQLRAIEKLGDRAQMSDGWQPEAESMIFEPDKALRALQKVLGLDEAIRCVECIDIAHLKGGETVGSKVSFIDGRPFKSEYRRYRIKTVEGGNDDYASIREVVCRRYREAGDGQELYPDVIIIDGGLGQLHAALEAFALLMRKPPMVISLAKKEELIYVQERTEPIRLPRTNIALKLCQAIRDEAHRFAQHYHHVLRRKKTLEE